MSKISPMTILRHGLLTIALLFSFNCIGCMPAVATTNSSIQNLIPSVLNEIEMRITNNAINSETRYITLEMKNNGSYRLLTGEEYKLQRYDKAWMDIPFKKNNRAFTAAGYHLDPGSTKAYEVDLSEHDVKESGLYRIGKPFLKDNAISYVFCEFNLSVR